MTTTEPVPWRLTKLAGVGTDVQYGPSPATWAVPAPESATEPATDRTRTAARRFGDMVSSDSRGIRDVKRTSRRPCGSPDSTGAFRLGRMVDLDSGRER